MLARMTPDEFDERWTAYQVEPWGDELQVASAIGAAIINQIIFATATEKVPAEDLLKNDHFLPKFDDEPERPTDGTSGFLKVMRQRIGV
jgi:hypothetical protein